MIRHDWTVEEALALFELPFMELCHQAQTMHQASPCGQGQLCTLSNIKSGAQRTVRTVLSGTSSTGSTPRRCCRSRRSSSRRCAKENGACFQGAAWRKVRDNKDFDRTSRWSRRVRSRPRGLRDAWHGHRRASSPARSGWATAYNHNIDTSPEHYERDLGAFEDRMRPGGSSKRRALRLQWRHVGMGETLRDRAGMLATLANLPEHPESVPINSLVAVETPLEDQGPVDRLTLRTIAVARLMMPQARSALRWAPQPVSRGSGARLHVRRQLDLYGDRLLTTDNPDVAADRELSLRHPARGQPQQQGMFEPEGRHRGQLMSAPSERLSALERQGCGDAWRWLKASTSRQRRARVEPASRSPRRCAKPWTPPPDGQHRLALAASGHSSQWVGSSAALRRGKRARRACTWRRLRSDIGLLAGMIEPGDIVLSDALNRMHHRWVTARSWNGAHHPASRPRRGCVGADRGRRGLSSSRCTAWTGLRRRRWR